MRMARDTDVDWSGQLPLRTGYGNLHDIGYGWDDRGLNLLARAITEGTDVAWRAVEEWVQKRKRRIVELKPS